MVVLAMYNSKGGVGKTASAINIAHSAASEGMKTLLWDLDPQGAATFYIQRKPRIKGGLKTILRRTYSSEKLIKATDYQYLDLIPADFSARNADILLKELSKSTTRVKKFLKPFCKWYDIIILDSPPGSSLLAENIFLASDYLVVPLIPTTLSVRSFELMLNHYKSHKLSRKNIIPFFSMVDRRKSIHKTTIDEFSQSFKRVLQANIPYSSDIEKMGIYAAPLNTFAPRSPAAKAYNQLWQEIKLIVSPRHV